MRLGTCCKSRCEQSTVWPVHVQTRGHFWSMLLVPPPIPLPLLPMMPLTLVPTAAVFAKFVPCTKMPTLPTLLNVPNDESPFPYGINCNSKITKLVVVAFTTQLSGGFFIFAIISHIWLLASIVIWVVTLCVLRIARLCSSLVLSSSVILCSFCEKCAHSNTASTLSLSHFVSCHQNYRHTLLWTLYVENFCCAFVLSDVRVHLMDFGLFEMQLFPANYNGFDHLIF